MPSSGSMIHVRSLVPSEPECRPPRRGWRRRGQWSRMERDDGGLALAVGARDPVVARLQIGVFLSRAAPNSCSRTSAPRRAASDAISTSLFVDGHSRRFYGCQLGYPRSDPCNLHRSPATAWIASSVPAAWARSISPRTTRLQPQGGAQAPAGALHQDEERVRRFQREARAASALNHPNIITIYDIGEAESASTTSPPSTSTARRCARRSAGSRCSIADVLDVGIGVAGALAAAHEAGIIHRDIKPENLMLRRDGYVKVLDFGLAKLAEPIGLSKDSHTGAVMGTLFYISPEQARGAAARRALRPLRARRRAVRDDHRPAAGARGELPRHGLGHRQPPARAAVGAACPACRRSSTASCSRRWRRTAPTATARCASCSRTSRRCARSWSSRTSCTRSIRTAARPPSDSSRRCR